MSDLITGAVVGAAASGVGKALVEVCKEFVGGVLAPRQLIRMAEAAEEVRSIELRGQIDRAGVEDRALRRILTEGVRQQENIEAIVEGALPHLRETATPQDIGQDWLARFFDSARDTSDAEMRILWSR